MTSSLDGQVTELLKSGGVGVLPTDTIYGLSCLALNEAAVDNLHRLKSRTDTKPFVILIADFNMLNQLSIMTSDKIDINTYWPGALTIIFDAPDSPKWLHRGLKSLAIRMPEPSNLRNLIRNVGPIVSTSVNMEGDVPASSVRSAYQIFGESLDFYVDGGKITNKSPSTIVRMGNKGWEIVRSGTVKIR